MLSNAVKELQSAKQQIAAQISGLAAEAQKIDQAIAALSGLSGGSVAVPVVAGKRKMSAAGRKAIAAAARARWARHNAKKAGKAASAKPAKKKRTMSAAARKAIGLAVKARWARQKAEAAPAAAAQ